VRQIAEHARSAPSRRSDTDITDLVSKYADLACHGMRALDASVQAEIDLERDPKAGTVALEPESIGRALLNLLNNAFQATRERAARMSEAYSPRVTVRTRRNEASVVAEVADNGDGVEPKIQNRIFEPFYTTRPPGSGTGLGLSISYDIVTKGHGGSLRLVAGNGGATFMVTLPVSTGARLFPEPPPSWTSCSVVGSTRRRRVSRHLSGSAWSQG
jgi:signal transduction histidine kinase